MAKRSKRKYGMNKMEPAVDTLFISTPTIGANKTESFYLDLSQCASLVNRRFYRQGINWAVGGMKIFTSGPTTMSVLKLPNTWVMFQAYKAAFDAWNKQQRDAIEEAGSDSAVAPYRDFKIYADIDHVGATYGSNLLPYDMQTPAQPYAVGEWEASEIVLPNSGGSGYTPTQRQLHMVGNNVNGTVSRGIIEGYADSRAYPLTPDPLAPQYPDMLDSQNWLARMFDSGNEISEVLENAIDRNDNMPYPQVDYPGGSTQAPTMQLHALATSTSTTVGGMMTIKGGTFPCGLIKFTISNTDSTARNVVFTIDMVPGMHRGYMCESMLE